MMRSKQVYLNQQTIEELEALTDVLGDESRVLQVAIEMLFNQHFPNAEPNADPDMREMLVEIHKIGSAQDVEPALAETTVKHIAGQNYYKSNFGHFYTVADEGRSRALEGRFCEEIIFPVASKFAEYDGQWRYHFDDKSGFLHGVATVNGEIIPEDDTNGWYSMVMYIERIDPEAARALPHNPHPEYSGDQPQS